MSAAGAALFEVKAPPDGNTAAAAAEAFAARSDGTGESRVRAETHDPREPVV